MQAQYGLHRLRWYAGVLVLVLLAACGGTAESEPDTATPQRVLSVGMAIGRGGLGDRAFNDSANEGLNRAQNDLGVRGRVVELERDTQENNLRALAAEEHDLIIALGQEYIESLTVVAGEFPDQQWAIIDAEVDAPNVTSITFRELEGDFLAGALTALLSETGTVGFLGGADIFIIRRIEDGWMQGVRYVNPEAVMLREYAGGVDDFSAFAKPELGQELAAAMYDGGADVVYAAAGRTSLGAVDAAAQHGALVITTGSDVRYLNPEVVATSRTKNMDVAVYTLIEELQAGTLQSGTRVLDLTRGGVSLAALDGPMFDEELVNRIQGIERALQSGELVVEPYEE